MKQIFDWLREQMQKAEYNHTYYGTDFAVNTERAIEIIDEAEAKWESDCCVVNHFNGNRIVVEVHSNQFYRRCVDEWNFCPYCGKPIKISEVE